ncbi:MAG: acyl carrier protein [Pseudonocardiaceae bacterium]
MVRKELTIDDLTTILRAAAGADERVNLEGDILDVEFTDLGYDSLALMETGSRIEREFGATFDEDTVLSATTPRAFLAAVNESAAQGSDGPKEEISL